MILKFAARTSSVVLLFIFTVTSYVPKAKDKTSQHLFHAMYVMTHTDWCTLRGGFVLKESTPIRTFATVTLFFTCPQLALCSKEWTLVIRQNLGVLRPYYIVVQA